ncbi:MAG: methyltransferase domain-containing protein, partial [Bacteroidota bacterium]
MIDKEIKNILKKIIYGGIKYKCTICGSRIRTFLPNGLDFPVLKDKKIVGGYKVQNGRCPICKRNERERLLFKYLFQYSWESMSNIDVLHVAPESSIAKKFKEISTPRKINYVAGDKFEQGYSYDCEELDITKMPYTENSFDLLICNHVLEHV